MSFESHLIHTCVIKRDTETAENRLGGPGTVTTETIYSGVCRLVEKVQRVYESETASLAAVTVYKLMLPLTAAVLERDRVTKVTLEDGTELEDAFVLKQGLRRRRAAVAFLSIDLERVS